MCTWYRTQKRASDLQSDWWEKNCWNINPSKIIVTATWKPPFTILEKTSNSLHQILLYPAILHSSPTYPHNTPDYYIIIETEKTVPFQIPPQKHRPIIGNKRDKTRTFPWRESYKSSNLLISVNAAPSNQTSPDSHSTKHRTEPHIVPNFNAQPNNQYHIQTYGHFTQISK